jgi:hypothetical protein
MWLRNRAAPIGYQKKAWAAAPQELVDHHDLTGLSSSVCRRAPPAVQVRPVVPDGDPPVRDLYRTEAEVFTSPVGGVYVSA